MKKKQKTYDYVPVRPIVEMVVVEGREGMWEGPLRKKGKKNSRMALSVLVWREGFFNDRRIHGFSKSSYFPPPFCARSGRCVVSLSLPPSLPSSPLALPLALPLLSLPLSSPSLPPPCSMAAQVMFLGPVLLLRDSVLAREECRPIQWGVLGGGGNRGG